MHNRFSRGKAREEKFRSFLIGIVYDTIGLECVIRSRISYILKFSKKNIRSCIGYMGSRIQHSWVLYMACFGLV